MAGSVSIASVSIRLPDYFKYVNPKSVNSQLVVEEFHWTRETIAR